MAYNVSALVNYVDEQRFPLLRRTVASAKTAGLITIQTGVKNEAALNLFDTDIHFQDDACSRTASGSVTLTQRKLKVAPIAIHQDFCPKDLEKKYLQTQVLAGSRQSEIPFEQEFATLVADRIADELETAIWQSVSGSGAGNLGRFDGFLKLINDATGSGVVDGNVANISGSITTTNVEEIMDSVYQALPERLLDKEDLAIMVGFDTFRKFTVALKDSNLFHYSAAAVNFEMFIPGTNVKIVALKGLNGTNKLVAARTSNLFYGVDLESEEDDFELWYSNDERIVKMSVGFKYGVQFAFPDEIVLWQLGGF